MTETGASAEAPSVHAHHWLSRPVTDAAYSWKCADDACGEIVTLNWRPEWAGLGFRDVERIVEAEYGGTVAPWEPAPLTDEQAAEFCEKLAAVLPGGVKVLPPRPLLTPETARELAREYVTILQPGEVLLIRVPDGWTPQQVHETQQRISEIIAHRELGIAVMLLPGEEFAVAKNREAA